MPLLKGAEERINQNVILQPHFSLQGRDIRRASGTARATHSEMSWIKKERCHVQKKLG
jgi:hypothetical protein